MLGRVSYGYAAEIISKYFPWMGRILHTHNKTSVVVSIVHTHGISTLEGECQAPVAADIYRPMPLKLAEQGVQSPARRVHVLRRLRIIQRKKLLPQPLGMVRLDFRLRSSPEELLDTLVPEALYHPYSVYYRYTFGQTLCRSSSFCWARGKGRPADLRGPASRRQPAGCRGNFNGMSVVWAIW